MQKADVLAKPWDKQVNRVLTGIWKLATFVTRFASTSNSSLCVSALDFRPLALAFSYAMYSICPTPRDHA